MTSIILDFLTYERVERGEQSTIYYNCIIKRDFGNYKVGQHVDSIIVQVSLHMCQGNDYVDEVVITL